MSRDDFLIVKSEIIMGIDGKEITKEMLEKNG
jgi:hypothetical protein